MGRTGTHAVVIGASIGGLCAARVLSDFYDRVTIYERDELPDGPANRAAVPQGRHVHLLMARGAAGVRDALPRSARRHGRRRGADSGEPARLHPLRRRRARTGHAPPRCSDEFTAYVPSRPHLEWQIRRRVRRSPNVEMVARRGRRAPIRRGPATGDRCACWTRTTQRGRRRSRRRRHRARHPAAGLVGQGGVSSARARTPSTSASATRPIRCASPTACSRRRSSSPVPRAQQPSGSACCSTRTATGA